MTAAEKKKGISLPVKIIIGLISGTAWAVLSSIMGWSHFTLDWIAPFGDIFINLLKLIAIPLVLFSIISGVSGLSDITKLGRTGLGMMSLYLATTFIAVSVRSLPSRVLSFSPSFAARVMILIFLLPARCLSTS